MWIADYGDPFSLSNSMPPNNFKIYGSLNHFVEKKVLKNADKVIFTNETTKIEYARVFDVGSLDVIPHVVDVNAFYSKDIYRKNRPRILYIGGFHKNIREPYLMISTMNQLGKILGITTEVYGPLNGFTPEELSADFVRYEGLIERDVAILYSRSNCILINVENINCVMTPSKVVEVVATGNPIINFHEQQRSRLLVDERLQNNIFHVDANVGVSKLLNFVNSRIHQRVSINETRDILKAHSLETISSRYLEAH